MVTFHQYQMTDKDKDDPLAAKHSATGEYFGMVEKRRTTDILFLLLIIAMWVVMTVFGVDSVQNGDPWRLIRPVNDEGQICGQTEEVQDLTRFYTVLTNGIGVCVDSCQTFNSSLTSTDPDDYYCLNSIYENVGTGATLEAYISTTCFSNGEFDIDSNCGCQMKFTTEDVLLRCTFTESSIRNEFDSQRVKNYLINFVGDVYDVKGLIFGYGSGAAVVLGFIWITVLRFQIFSMIFTWTSVILVEAAFIVMMYLAWVTAEDWDDDEYETHTTSEIVGLRVFATLMLILSVIWFLFICINCKNIQLAIRCLGLTAEAVESMPLIIFTPVMQVTALVIFGVPWAIYMFHTASLGSLETTSYELNGITINYVTYSVDQEIAGRLFYLFFCFLWTGEWILAVGSIIISIAIATWYFTKPDERGLAKGSNMLCKAYGETIRYHLGTAAFGSLIVAIVEFIRYWILYLEAKMKVYEANPCIKYTMCCVNCCVCCVEACLRFISKAAYVQTAIHGSSFCWACKEAFFLICRNVLRIGTLHVVAGIAMMIGKIFIMGIVGTTAFYIFDTKFQSDMNGMAAPTIMTMIVAYYVACMFTEVMTTAVGCMIQCFIYDEEVNGKAVFATSSMADFIDENTMTQEEFDKANPRAKDDKGSAEEMEPVSPTKA